MYTHLSYFYILGCHVYVRNTGNDKLDLELPNAFCLVVWTILKGSVLEQAMSKHFQDLSDSSSLHEEKPIEMKIVPTFQIRSRVITIDDRRIQLMRHHTIFHMVLPIVSDVRDTRKDSVKVELMML